MKQRKKLISLICAFCLVLCLGVFGVLAVTELNLNIGGEIKFSATGVKATIGTGRLVTGKDTANLTDYAGVWQSDAVTTNKLAGFDVTTQKADYTNEITNWSGLKLQFNENGDSVYLYFTIKNNATDGTSIKVTLTNATTATGTNNVNTSILLPTINPILPGVTENVFIEFKVNNKLVDASLKDFALNIKLERTAVGVIENASNGIVSNYTDLKYTAIKYTLNDDGTATAESNTASSEVVILGTIYDGEKTYSVKTFNAHMGNSPLLGSTTVEKIIVEEGVETIFPGLMACSNLTYLSLPSTLTTFPTLNNCSKLSTLKLAEGLTIIGDSSTIMGCSSLTELYIPASVTTIGAGAFAYCENLQKIVIDEQNPIFTSEYNCIYNTQTKTIVKATNTTIIPSDTEIIDTSAFMFLSFKEINLPDSVKEIKDMAFSNSDLETITLPQNLTTIGGNAFMQTKLTTITIPASVTTIGLGAFASSETLTAIHFQRATMPTCEDLDGYYSEFAPKTTKIYIPTGSKTSYSIFETKGYTLIEE